MMDLQSQLIESRKRKREGGWGASAFSLGFHGTLIGLIIFSGLSASHKLDAEQKPIRAFITQGAAPPPPPPPPPPPAASNAPKATPKIQPKIEPKPVTQSVLIPPTEIPKEIPKVEIPTAAFDLKPSEPSTPSVPSGGVVGGVPGGVVGGVVGGVKGGVIGGEIGGVLGGEIGGVKGGQLGGKGTGTEGEGTGGKEAPPSGPVRVGGDVKAPKVLDRVEPEYTDIARQARVTGVVVVEAIIDKNGNVDHVRVLKGLPMGLGESAERAVRKWKFRPGTLNGQPVDVIFNLTVTFKLD